MKIFGESLMRILNQLYPDKETLKISRRTRCVTVLLALCGLLMMAACNRSNVVTEREQPSGQTAATSTPQVAKCSVS